MWNLQDHGDRVGDFRTSYLTIPNNTDGKNTASLVLYCLEQGLFSSFQHMNSLMAIGSCPKTKIERYLKLIVLLLLGGTQVLL